MDAQQRLAGMIWHLYDWYLRPGGSYFGTKKACEPLHVQYSYDDRSVVVVNSKYERIPGLKVSAKVYNLDMSVKFSREAALDAEPDNSARVFVLPEIDSLSSTYFVSLKLERAGGAEVSRNFYWLSTKPETLDWEKSTWYHTPTRSFADYAALNRLPQVELNVSAQSSEGSTAVTVSNPSRSLAFGVHLKVKKSSNEEVLPVLWQDNYFALLPGETRVLTATYRPEDSGVGSPAVEVEGWNVRSKVVGQ